MSTDAPVLVFDGVCVLCSRSVQFVLRHDADRRFRFATNQSSTGARLMRDHGLDPERPVSVLLVEGNRGWRDSAAAIRVLFAFGGGWKLLGGLIWIIPRPLRDSIYRYVAGRRYTWFGKRDACFLPEPENRLRFLD